MFHILRHFILNILFALFASQASAMFIQPDWFDSSDPQVGTNRYAYSHNDPINLADSNGNVPYNPGGTTSTGWTQHEDNRETYDSRTDRGSSDNYQSSTFTIGEYNPNSFHDNEYGSPTRTRSGVQTSAYNGEDSGHRRAEHDALNFDGRVTKSQAAGLALAPFAPALVGLAAPAAPAASAPVAAGLPVIAGTNNVGTGAIIGWGTKVSGARNALAGLTDDAVKEMARRGLTKDTAIALRDFYARAAAKGKGNTLRGGNPASARAELMGNIVARGFKGGLWK